MLTTRPGVLSGPSLAARAPAGSNRSPASLRVCPRGSKRHSSQSEGGDRHVFSLLMTFQDNEVFSFSAWESYSLKTMSLESHCDVCSSKPKPRHLSVKCKWAYGGNGAEHLSTGLAGAFETHDNVDIDGPATRTQQDHPATQGKHWFLV